MQTLKLSLERKYS